MQLLNDHGRDRDYMTGSQRETVRNLQAQTRQRLWRERCIAALQNGTLVNISYVEAVAHCFKHTSDPNRVIEWLEEANISIPSPNSIPFD